MIAGEYNDRALRSAGIGKRVGFSVDALERKVTRLPAEVANTIFAQSHRESSATQAVYKADAYFSFYGIIPLRLTTRRNKWVSLDPGSAVLVKARF